MSGKVFLSTISDTFQLIDISCRSFFCVLKRRKIQIGKSNPLKPIKITKNVDDEKYNSQNQYKENSRLS